MVNVSNRIFHTLRSSWTYPLGVIFIIYATFSFYQIDLPGLHYDEAFEAVPALQLLLGKPVTAFRGSVLTLGRHSFPLMTQDYIGAINTYMTLPFIAILGSTPAALRAMSIITGAITLGLTYILAYQLTNKHWVGLTAALLLSVEPTFIFWNRQGIFVTAVTATIGLAVACCWLRRFQGGSTRWGVAGAFLFGLGIYAKFLFLWLIAALVGAIILLNICYLLSRLISYKTNPMDMIKRPSLIEIVTTLPAFLLGCSPLIVYNIQTGGTFLNITQNATTSYYGVDNLAVGSNLVERLSQFITLLNGTHLWYLGDINKNIWGSLFFGLVMFFVVCLATRRVFPFPNNPPSPTTNNVPGTFSPDKVALFPFLVIGLVILASIGTVSALWITHFAILMPWPALAIAIGIWRLDEAGKILKLLILAGLGILVITNLFSTIRYHLALTESGGLSSHSDAIYDLSDWLAQHAGGPVVAMDWGLAAPVTYLTHGQITTAEIFGYEWQSDIQLTERLTGFIAQPDTLYLWRAPDEIIFDRSAEFKALYRPQNLEETIEEAFYERSGRPILGVTRLVEKGTAGNPP